MAAKGCCTKMKGALMCSSRLLRLLTRRIVISAGNSRGAPLNGNPACCPGTLHLKNILAVRCIAVSIEPLTAVSKVRIWSGSLPSTAEGTTITQASEQSTCKVIAAYQVRIA